MVVGAKVCELTDGFLWFVCGNFDVSPYHSLIYCPMYEILELPCLIEIPNRSMKR